MTTQQRLTIFAVLPLLVMGIVHASVASPPTASAIGGRSVDVSQFPGEDLAARLRAADAALGSDTGTILIRSAAKLTAATTLGNGHSLRLEAPVTWSATMSLAGANDVGCGPGGSIAAETPAAVAVFSARGVQGLTIHDCTVRTVNNSPVLLGEGIHDLTITGLTVNGGSIAQINPSHGGDAGGAAGRFRFAGNVVHDAPNTGGAALLLVNTTDATVTGNTFDGISTGTQWWGGDSAHGNLAAVNRTGRLTLTGNTCHDVTACLWGSMGFGITVAQNKADGCGDVCFDAEGGRDTSFEGNVATRCGNGCGAIFFFSNNISFKNNDFSGDAKGGGLIFIKNVSADPRTHTGFVVALNKLSCLSVCNAFYQEAVSQARFEGNTITNGIFASAGFGQDISIVNNQFTLTKALPPNTAVINAPSITGGTTLTVAGNTVSSMVPQGANNACIRAIWNDFNNSDTYNIERNHCGGASPLPLGIVTETAGANPGPHAIWTITGNDLATGALVHHRTTTNDVYNATNNCTGAGCTGR